MNIKMKVVKFKSTDQFDSVGKCNFKMHFKGPNFAQVINPCANFIS